MSKFHSPWRKNTPGARTRKGRGYRGGPPTGLQYREAHPRPIGGAGEHFPFWVSASQALNHLSFNDFAHLFPDLAQRMGEDPRYMPDRAVFKKVRSRGSPKWGQVAQ